MVLDKLRHHDLFALQCAGDRRLTAFVQTYVRARDRRRGLLARAMGHLPSRGLSALPHDCEGHLRYGQAFAACDAPHLLKAATASYVGIVKLLRPIEKDVPFTGLALALMGGPAQAWATETLQSMLTIKAMTRLDAAMTHLDEDVRRLLLRALPELVQALTVALLRMRPSSSSLPGALLQRAWAAAVLRLAQLRKDIFAGVGLGVRVARLTDVMWTHAALAVGLIDVFHEGFDRTRQSAGLVPGLMTLHGRAGLFGGTAKIQALKDRRVTLLRSALTQLTATLVYTLPHSHSDAVVSLLAMTHRLFRPLALNMLHTVTVAAVALEYDEVVARIIPHMGPVGHFAFLSRSCRADYLFAMVAQTRGRPEAERQLASAFGYDRSMRLPCGPLMRRVMCVVRTYDLTWTRAQWGRYDDAIRGADVLDCVLRHVRADAQGDEADVLWAAGVAWAAAAFERAVVRAIWHEATAGGCDVADLVAHCARLRAVTPGQLQRDVVAEIVQQRGQAGASAWGAAEREVARALLAFAGPAPDIIASAAAWKGPLWRIRDTLDSSPADVEAAYVHAAFRLRSRECLRNIAAAWPKVRPPARTFLACTAGDMDVAGFLLKHKVTPGRAEWGHLVAHASPDVLLFIVKHTPLHSVPDTLRFLRDNRTPPADHMYALRDDARGNLSAALERSNSF